MSVPSSSSSSSPSLPPLPDSTTGHCACKRTYYRVQLTSLQQDLRLSAYCHCTSCQRLNGAPFVWTTHWAEEAVQWSSVALEGEDESPASSSSHPGSRRTRGNARLIPSVSSAASSSSSSSSEPVLPEATFAPTMAVYETLPGRKWKQRCDYCGTPLGSWNQAKRQWTLWPSTLSREYLPSTPSSAPALSGSSPASPPPAPAPPREGLPHPTVQQAIRVQHHQFYGWWRTMDVRDGLPKWEGYAGASERVEE